MKFRNILHLLLAFAFAGCSTSFYRKSADREAGAVISQKTGRVPNMDPKFGIQTGGSPSLAGLPANKKVDEFMGEDGESERGEPVLSLEKALEIAVNHSPSYQDRKEDLFLSALKLTLARHQFSPIFSGGGTIINKGVHAELSADPGNSGASSVTDTLAEQYRAHGSAGVDWLIRDIGRISVAATTDFTRFVTGGGQSIGGSSLGASLTRPLLRNAGFKREVENLTQADRDLLYAMREFTRYRKTFSVGIASDYYSILNQRDQVRNSYVSLKNSRGNVERGRSLASEGRMSQSDLGRLEQSGLSRESSWISAVRSYKTALDSFKISLGVPVKTRLLLDDRELDRLKIENPEIGIEDAIRVADAARLDLQTSADKSADAQRRVSLAAEGLKPQLDLQAGGSLAGARTYALPGLNASNYQWNGGAIVDLGLDRKAQRNDYRSALIDFERAKRALKQDRDQVELAVRESYRSLEKSKRDYEIYQRGVELAQRRVEEQELRAELGLAKAQDQVDAQNDLVEYKNRLTDALISHTNDRLRFWNNIGILYIKDAGKWYTHMNAPKKETHGGKAN